MKKAFLIRSFATGMFLSLGWFAYTQTQAPKLTIAKVKEDLYEIEGDGGNVGVLVTTDGVILIDDKFDQDHDAIVARHIAQSKGRLVKTTGDGVVALFDGPGRAIRCAAAMRDELRSIGLRTRSGIHAGEIELRSDDIGGIAVHIAARVMSKGDADQILVSRTVRDLVTGSGFAFISRGMHSLKGIPDQWDLYEVAI